jgi:hypothetical protein
MRAEFAGCKSRSRRADSNRTKASSCARARGRAPRLATSTVALPRHRACRSGALRGARHRPGTFVLAEDGKALIGCLVKPRCRADARIRSGDARDRATPHEIHAATLAPEERRNQRSPRSRSATRWCFVLPTLTASASKSPPLPRRPGIACAALSVLLRIRSATGRLTWLRA